jgi:hypothetical protein
LWTQTQRIAASDGSDLDGFGGALALGDPTPLVVGASKNGSGSAYVYSLSAGTWVERQKITPPDGELGQQFGASLALMPRILRGTRASRSHSKYCDKFTDE